MKVLSVLLQVNLFNYAVNFVVRKTTIYHPMSPDIVNNLNDAASGIKFTFLASNRYQGSSEVPSIGNLIKSLRVPGFNVYSIVFNGGDTRNYEQVKPTPKSNIQVTTKKLNKTDDNVSNNMFENQNNSIRNFNEINKPPNTELVDQRLIQIDCDLKNSIDNSKCKEETTTNIVEVTTDIDQFNENSTVTSEYDDENFGSLSDRSNIPPGLLASLVG